MPRKVTHTVETFLSRVDVRGPDECWEWQGTRNPQGYGGVRHDGVNWRAHRLSYVLHKGPIPDGLLVLHSCDNPPCCNPSHLRTGTYADNMLDMVGRQRHLPRVGVLPSARNRAYENARKTARRASGIGRSRAKLAEWPNYCSCGRTVHGNGGKSAHAVMHERLGDGHHYVTQAEQIALVADREDKPAKCEWCDAEYSTRLELGRHLADRWEHLRERLERAERHGTALRGEILTACHADGEKDDPLEVVRAYVLAYEAAESERDADQREVLRLRAALKILEHEDLPSFAAQTVRAALARPEPSGGEK